MELFVQLTRTTRMSPYRTFGIYVLFLGTILSTNLAHADNNALLGFEDSTLWNTEVGTISANTLHTQGAYALEILPNGFTPINSANYSGSGAIEYVSFDILIPEYQPEPDWWGQVLVFISCPSHYLNNVYLGEIPLTNLPTEQWETLLFEVPEYAVSQLAGAEYGDLFFTISLNVPQGSDTYLLDNLRINDEHTEGPIILNTNEHTDTPILVTPNDRDIIPLVVPPEVQDDPESIAMAFLKSYQDLFAIDEPTVEFAHVSTKDDKSKFLEFQKTHVTMRQMYQGLPVFNATIKVHLTPQLDVYAASGNSIATVQLNTQPSITQSAAESTAVSYIENFLIDIEHAINYNDDVTVELGVFHKYFEGDDVNINALTYKVKYNQVIAYVDAHTGDVLYIETNWHGADIWQIDNFFPMLTIYEMNGESYSPQGGEKKTQQFFPIGLLPYYLPDDGAYYGMHGSFSLVWDMFNEEYEWRSYSQISLHVNIDEGGYYHPDDNAISLSDRDFVFDIVCHEYTHLLSQEAADFDLSQSKSVNEGYSDFFACLTEYYPLSDMNWLFGEDQWQNDPIRSLSNPSSINGSSGYYHADDLEDSINLTVPPYSDSYATYMYNLEKGYAQSTILSHAMYLLTEGGSNNDITVESIGGATTADVMMRALQYYSPTESLTEAAVHLIMAAEELESEGFISSFDVNQVEAAMRSAKLID